MYKIVVDHAPSRTDNDLVMDGLIAFNEGIIGEPRDRVFSIFLKSELEKICGGIQAHFDREAVYIEALWIEEPLRNQGYGKKMLAAAEQEAMKHGCIFSITDTLSFQAEAFYLKFGYVRMGEIKNYWYQHSRIFLRKDLR